MSLTNHGTHLADQAGPSQVIAEAEHLRVTMSGPVVIAELIDLDDGGPLDALGRLLCEVDAPVVIDLRHCPDRDAARASLVDPHRCGRDPGSVCVVTDPRSARQLARHGLAVFTQPADAVQALLLAESGYGNGWS